RAIAMLPGTRKARPRAPQPKIVDSYSNVLGVDLLRRNSARRNPAIRALPGTELPAACSLTITRNEPREASGVVNHDLSAPCFDTELAEPTELAREGPWRHRQTRGD